MKAYQWRVLAVLAVLLGLPLVAAPPIQARPGGASPAPQDGSTPPAYTLDPRTAGDDAGAAEEEGGRPQPVQMIPRWFGRLVLPGFSPTTHDFSLLDALRRGAAPAIPAGSAGALGVRLVLGPGLVAAAAALPPPPPRTGTLRFAVIGDFGDATGPPAGTVATLVHSWAPDFVLTVGDNNYPSGRASTIDANIGQYYHDYIYPYTGSYGAGATANAFFPALGNHDWETTGAQPYLNYFTLPGNERYYDFRQGPVQFFAVDSDSRDPDGYTSTSRQALWLRDRLAASTAAWKIVYLHEAPYSSGSIHGSTAELQWPYQQWGASAVLAGHDHDYERIIKAGFPYFVNGLGGCDGCIYSFNTPVAGSVVRYNGDYGALLGDADEGSLTFQFITRTGVSIDSYTLTAATATPGPVSPPPTPTASPVLPSATPTASPEPPSGTPTAGPVPPSVTATASPEPPSVTATASPVLPSATSTLPPSVTLTATGTPTLPPSATATLVPSVTPTRTRTPLPLTTTPTRTRTPLPSPSATRTRTPLPPTSPPATATPTLLGDFTLSVTPTSRTLVRGSSTTYTVTLTSVNGFAGPVNLSVSSLPNRVTAVFNPNPVALGAGGTATAILTITTGRTGPTGTFALTIRGVSGALTHSSNVTLTITR